MKYEMIKNYVFLDWVDIYWAYKKQLIGWRDVVNYASDCVLKGNLDVLIIEISFIHKNTVFNLDDLLSQLNIELKNYNIDKWLYIKLKDLFDNRSLVFDPLGEVEKIYAEFDYPKEIESFVRYMPTINEMSVGNSPEENINQLYKNWEKYLNEVCIKWA